MSNTDEPVDNAARYPDFPPCVCGHSADDHHTSWFRGGQAIREECEAEGYNETGGMLYVDGKWVEHCQRYQPAS